MRAILLIEGADEAFVDSEGADEPSDEDAAADDEDDEDNTDDIRLADGADAG